MGLAKFIKATKNTSSEKYLENLFLEYFPYNLAENFEYSAEAKKLNSNQHQVIN